MPFHVTLELRHRGVNLCAAADYRLIILRQIFAVLTPSGTVGDRREERDAAALVLSISRRSTCSGRTNVVCRAERRIDSSHSSAQCAALYFREVDPFTA